MLDSGKTMESRQKAAPTLNPTLYSLGCISTLRSPASSFAIVLLPELANAADILWGPISKFEFAEPNRFRHRNFSGRKPAFKSCVTDSDFSSDLLCGETSHPRYHDTSFCYLGCGVKWSCRSFLVREDPHSEHEQTLDTRTDAQCVRAQGNAGNACLNQQLRRSKTTQLITIKDNKIYEFKSRRRKSR